MPQQGEGSGRTWARPLEMWTLPSIRFWAANHRGALLLGLFSRNCGCKGAEGVPRVNSIRVRAQLPQNANKRRTGSAETSPSQDREKEAATQGKAQWPVQVMGPFIPKRASRTSCQPSGLSTLQVPHHRHLISQWPSKDWFSDYN